MSKNSTKLQTYPCYYTLVSTITQNPQRLLFGCLFSPTFKERRPLDVWHGKTPDIILILRFIFDSTRLCLPTDCPFRSNVGSHTLMSIKHLSTTCPTTLLCRHRQFPGEILAARGTVTPGKAAPVQIRRSASSCWCSIVSQRWPGRLSRPHWGPRKAKEGLPPYTSYTTLGVERVSFSRRKWWGVVYWHWLEKKLTINVTCWLTHKIRLDLATFELSNAKAAGILVRILYHICHRHLLRNLNHNASMLLVDFYSVLEASIE